MNDLFVATLPQVILLLVPALLAGLSFMVKRWFVQRKQQRVRWEKSRTTRQLVSLEINRNLRFLEDFWIKLEHGSGRRDSHPRSKEQAILELLDNHLPAWQHEMWQQHLTLLPGCLTEEELQQGDLFHEYLKRLGELYEELGELEEERQEALERLQIEEFDLQPSGNGNLSNLLPMSTKAYRLHEEFLRILRLLVCMGNPLERNEPEV